MIRIVLAAVTEVDAADKRKVPDLILRVADDHKLLMMGATEPHPLIEEHLAPGFVHDRAEVAVLLGAESETVCMRPPEQAFDSDSAPHRSC